MEDKDLMEAELLNIKGACDLYLHAAIESSTPKVNRTFCSALNNTLSMQEQIYKQMEQKGWYVSDSAPQQKIEQVKQKFTVQN